jgi:hypothetical protein
VKTQDLAFNYWLYLAITLLRTLFFELSLFGGENLRSSIGNDNACALFLLEGVAFGEPLL